MNSNAAHNYDQLALRQKIEVMSARLRVTVIALIAVILGLLIWMLFSIYSLQVQNRQLLDNQTSLLDHQRQAVAALEKNLNDQLQRQTQYIQCIANFFAQPDRNNKVLADLNSCNIKVMQSPQTSVAPMSTGTPVGQGHPSTQSAPAPMATNNQTQQEASTTPTTPPPSKKILKLSICVPLTRICLEDQ